MWLLPAQSPTTSGQIAVGGGFEALVKNSTSGATNFHILADHGGSQIFEWSGGNNDVTLKHQTLCLKPSSLDPNPPDSSVATAGSQSDVDSRWGAWSTANGTLATDAQYHELAPDAWNETSVPVVPRPRLHGVGLRFAYAQAGDLSPSVAHYESFVFVEPQAGTDISYIRSGYHSLHWPSP
jgi:hypothetical protein